MRARAAVIIVSIPALFTPAADVATAFILTVVLFTVHQRFAGK